MSYNNSINPPYGLPRYTNAYASMSQDLSPGASYNSWDYTSPGSTGMDYSYSRSSNGDTPSPTANFPATHRKGSSTNPSGSVRDPSRPTGAETSPQYYCLAANCTTFTSRAADLQRHVTAKHFTALAERCDCEYPGCRRVGDNGFTRRDKMVEHMREVHHVNIPKRSQGRQNSGTYS